MASESEELLRSINSKIDQMLRLTALQIVANMKQSQAIQTLSAAGFDRKLIADLLGTTPNTVSVTLAKAKARQRPREIPTVDPTTLLPAQEKYGS